MHSNILMADCCFTGLHYCTKKETLEFKVILNSQMLFLWQITVNIVATAINAFIFYAFSFTIKCIAMGINSIGF